MSQFPFLDTIARLESALLFNPQPGLTSARLSYDEYERATAPSKSRHPPIWKALSVPSAPQGPPSGLIEVQVSPG
jgi:hypothetical protein